MKRYSFVTSRGSCLGVLARCANMSTTLHTRMWTSAGNPFSGVDVSSRLMLVEC